MSPVPQTVCAVNKLLINYITKIDISGHIINKKVKFSRDQTSTNFKCEAGKDRTLQ